MDMNIKQDLDVPIAFAYERLIDFDAHERRATLAGIILNSKTVGPSSHHWNVTFEWRGRDRTVDIEVSDLQEPSHLLIASNSPNLFAEADVKLLPLSPQLTRMRVKSKINGKTLKARLMVQSARLAKQSIQKRLQGRLAGLASEIEFDFLQSRG